MQMSPMVQDAAAIIALKWPVALTLSLSQSPTLLSAVARQSSREQSHKEGSCITHTGTCSHKHAYA